LASIHAGLLTKLKKELNLKRSRVYKLIEQAAVQHSQPKNVAALIVARDNGINFLKYASPVELAVMQQIKNHQPVYPAAPAPVLAGAATARPLRRRRGAPAAKASKKRKDAVFVVHGRDKEARKELSSFLGSLHIYIIEWEKALALTKKGSPYIGEVIDAGLDHAQAIVVLMTPDDEAKLRDSLVEKSDPAFERKLTGQPRQNVIFEAGMAFGKYKDTTILVQIGKLRTMSDVSGVHTVHLTNSPASRRLLIGKLRTTGVTLDDTGNNWLTAGDFDSF